VTHHLILLELTKYPFPVIQLIQKFLKNIEVDIGIDSRIEENGANHVDT
jgi:hypothetical protein